ncbi:unnamed protein product [Auanema sp. JU1783]|nr:unnamed protein product [Auanema sp. JU1783]
MNLESKLLDGKNAGYCSSSDGEDEPWTVAKDDDEHQAKVMSKMGTSGNTGPKGVLNDYKDFLEEQKREKAFKTKELLRQAKRGILTGTREDREAAAEDSEEDDLENLRARRLREMQKAAQGRMAELTEKSQFTSIIDSCRDQLLGILLYEPDVESCNKISHVCKILACDHPQVKFARVKSTILDMSKAFTEKAIPSLQFYQNGELVGNFVQLNSILGLDYNSAMLKRFLKTKRISLDKGRVVSDSECSTDEELD